MTGGYFMKRVLAILILVSMAGSSQAGMVYDFKSLTEGKGGTELSGRAAIEGKNVRLEITRGDGLVFKNDSVVLSSDSGASFKILDPAKKTYYPFSVDELLGSLGNVVKSLGGMFQMDIENQKVNLTDGGAGPKIEGYPTRKYVMTSNYDMHMKIMGMKSSTKVKSRTEAWTTDQIGVEFMTFVQKKNLSTGIEDLDKLLKAQATGIKGFPLKQVTTMTNTAANGKSTTNVTTMTITGIRKESLPATRFTIPTGYKEIDAPTLLPQAR